ncbi:hypothetical protein KJ975_01405, partial [Myxococcota bacterium]|nr:hypothetical protein [Myxococcota bacterium]
PTLCADLWPVVERMKAAGVLVSLITNGRDDSEAFAAQCGESGLDFVWLSLDGPAPVHDWIRRRPGGFARLMRTGRNLAAAGVRFGFMTTLLGANRAELAPLAELVREAGADLWQISLGLQNGREPGLFLTAAEVDGMRAELERLTEREPHLMLGESLAMVMGAQPLRPQLRMVGSARDADAAGIGGCPAGRQVLAIAPDGRLRGCSCLPVDPADPFIVDGASLSVLADGLRALARERERELAPIALSSCGSVAAGFCQAMALRCAPLAEHSAPNYSRPQPADPVKNSPMTRSGGAVVLGSALLAGLLSCTGSKTGPEEKTTPPVVDSPSAMSPSGEAPPNTEPPVEPVVKGTESTPTSDATPAGTGPDRSTTNIVAPSATKPGMKPGAWVMPTCCMSHMLVPDCQCSPPPGTIPTP